MMHSHACAGEGKLVKDVLAAMDVAADKWSLLAIGHKVSTFGGSSGTKASLRDEMKLYVQESLLQFV